MSIADPGAGASASPQRPWLGLSSFTEATRAYFHGRDREIADLLDRIRAQPLTVLFGLSGRGKSSLLGAGILPELRAAGARPVILRLRQESLSFVDQLRAAWDQATGGARSDASLWERGYRQADRAALKAAPPVLILDQFEEVFTIGSQRGAELQALFREIACLVENRVPAELRERMAEDEAFAAGFADQACPARIVITLREDFLAQLEAWKGQLPSLMRNRMVLHPLNGPQALQAVLRPGRMGGTDLVDERTATAIVRFVAQVDDDTPLADIQAVPPLLSLLCFELNEDRLAHGAQAITLSQLEEQKSNILQNFYARCFEGLPAAARDVVESTLLVSESGHRNACTEADLLLALEAAGLARPQAERVVGSLVDSRLLTQEQHGGTRRIELTHDLLAPLVVRSRNETRAQRQLEAAQAEQAAAQQRTAQLLRQRRRLWVLAGAMGVLAVFALGATWFAFDARNEAHVALAEAQRQRAEALRQEGLAKEAETKVSRSLAAAEAEAQRSQRAELAASQSLADAQRQAQVAKEAERKATQAAMLARSNIDALLDTLESQAMDEVHGFEAVEKQLLDPLVPRLRELETMVGDDRTTAGLQRRTKLDLRDANRLRNNGEQVAAARVYRDILQRLDALPAGQITPPLRDVQFEALYRLDRTGHLLKDYDRGAWMARALTWFEQTPPRADGRQWREAIVQQIARHLRSRGQTERALALTERAIADLKRLDASGDDLWIAQSRIVLASEQVTSLKELDRKDEARRIAEASDEESARIFARHPRSRAWARGHLYTLFDQLELAYFAKDESRFEQVAAEAQAAVARFKGSEPLTFEAAEATLTKWQAEYRLRVKNDAADALALARQALEQYGRLYTGRSVELPNFDNLNESLRVLINVQGQIENVTGNAERPAVLLEHARQMVALSAPFLPCAKAMTADADCSQMVRRATLTASDRLAPGSPDRQRLVAERHELFMAPALAMVKADRELPPSVAPTRRGSTAPLSELCAIQNAQGRELLEAGRPDAARRFLRDAVQRCEPWATQYDFDFYLRRDLSKLMTDLARAQRAAHDDAGARATLARCWALELPDTGCQRPYAEMLVLGIGGPKDENLASEVHARRTAGRSFTIPARREGSTLTFPVVVHVADGNQRYKGIEGEALRLERNEALQADPVVRESMLKLDDIARQNKRSLPDLTLDVLQSANGKEKKASLTEAELALEHKVDALDKASDWAAAARVQKELVETLERRLTDTGDRVGRLPGEYLRLSWYQLHARQFDAVIQSAIAGQAIDQSDLTLHTNLAHALLFLGREAEGEFEYRTHIGQKVGSKLTWQEVVLDDLDRLEKAGLTHPRFAEVRKWMQAK